jgi:hypothetical protein
MLARRNVAAKSRLRAANRRGPQDIADLTADDLAPHCIAKPNRCPECGGRVTPIRRQQLLAKMQAKQPP